MSLSNILRRIVAGVAVAALLGVPAVQAQTAPKAAKRALTPAVSASSSSVTLPAPKKRGISG